MWFDEEPLASVVYDREDLHAGCAFAGPALVTQMDATTVIPPGWRVEVDVFGNLVATSDREGVPV